MTGLAEDESLSAGSSFAEAAENELSLGSLRLFHCPTPLTLGRFAALF